MADPYYLTALHRLSCDRTVAAAVLDAAGATKAHLARIRRVPSGNDVLRLDTDLGTFFLKAPAKDLEPWPDPREGAAARVAREHAAAECLRSYGLPGPEVVAADVSGDNPIGRPYLLTRKVEGRPFTTVVGRRARHGWRGPIHAVGAFLAAVHEIEFDAAGYLVTPDGPVGPTPPAPPRPSHDPAVAQQHAFADLERARPHLEPSLIADLEQRFGSMNAATATSYHPPRLVIGGFHPNHPFLARASEQWSVVGCIDLEVASGGRTLDDLVTFAVGLMFRFDAAVPWWEPLFEGYGDEPPLELCRLELLASCKYLFGGSRSLPAAYHALMAAPSWATLFRLPRRSNSSSHDRPETLHTAGAAPTPNARSRTRR
ncbi:MAG: phosphotransferase family protein [Acidimicrobiales bacterium]